MPSDIKKVFAFGRRFKKFSREAVLRYSLFSLFGVTLILIAGDAVIFLQYYQISVEPAHPVVLPQAAVSRSNLREVLRIISGPSAK